jgi:hypothetical protein
MRIALLILLALMAWVYWPATTADFVIDDYVFIVTSRMVDNPLPAFWQSHFYEPYYFRPLGLVSWWVATRAYAFDYQAHSVINLVIHALSVCSLAVLLRMLGVTRLPTLAAAALFALMPFSLAATMWPSNRFDLMAVLFLILLAISVLRVLRGAGIGGWILAALCALSACWSKELAYPIATAIAFFALFSVGVSMQRRMGVFVLLGITISFAFFWRQAMLELPYAAAGGDVVASMTKGVIAWTQSLPMFVRYALGASSFTVWVVAGVVATALVFRARNIKRRFAANSEAVERAHVHGNWLIAAAALTLLLVCAVQTPLAHVFTNMLDGGAFGTLTYARFYYAPMAVFAVLAGLVLSSSRFPKIGAVVVVLFAIVTGFALHPLGQTYANWTQKEVRPVSLAATALADAQPAGSPCVLVLLGTQSVHPYFRMFSDVTVKARTEKPEQTWRCHIMSESTPWIFAFPQNVNPLALKLPNVGGEGAAAKPDSQWGGIRYRYRLAPESASALPDARFYDWQGGRFVEVTEQVRSGARVVKFHGWGF